MEILSSIIAVGLLFLGIKIIYTLTKMEKIHIGLTIIGVLYMSGGIIVLLTKNIVPGIIVFVLALMILKWFK